MKKKIIIPLVFSIIILLCITTYLLLSKENLSTITIDINPSIELKVNKKNIVKKVKAINSDANDIIKGNVKDVNIDDAIKVITNNIIEAGYVKDNEVVVLVYTTGTLDNKKIKESINESFLSNNIHSEIILIDNISKEDKKLAEKYNISLSKAAYINSLDNKELDIKDLKDKSVNELNEIKETGLYCESGYELRGNECLKKISTEKPLAGDICPEGYLEYDGKCYKEEPSIETDKVICRDGFKYDGTNCIMEDVKDAIGEYTCVAGELGKKGDFFTIGIKDADKMVCVDKSNAKKPTLRCLTINHKIINGECYVGPAPTINGGCPNGDTLSGGGCYSKDNGDQWVCPNGSIYHVKQNSVPDLCPDTFIFKDATLKGYKCEEGYTLDGSKCKRTNTEEIRYERTCPSGYTNVLNDRCIDKTNIKEKVSGNYCQDDRARLEHSECVIYEIVKPLNN